MALTRKKKVPVKSAGEQQQVSDTDTAISCAVDSASLKGLSPRSKKRVLTNRASAARSKAHKRLRLKQLREQKVQLEKELKDLEQKCQLKERMIAKLSKKQKQ